MLIFRQNHFQFCTPCLKNRQPGPYYHNEKSQTFKAGSCNISKFIIKLAPVEKSKKLNTKQTCSDQNVFTQKKSNLCSRSKVFENKNIDIKCWQMCVSEPGSRSDFLIGFVPDSENLTMQRM